MKNCALWAVGASCFLLSAGVMAVVPVEEAAPLTTSATPGANTMAQPTSSEKTMYFSNQSTAGKSTLWADADPVTSQMNAGSAHASSDPAQLQRQVGHLLQLNIAAKLQNLQQQVATLRGQVQVATHDLKALASQQSNFYQELDQRIKRLSTIVSGLSVSGNNGTNTTLKSTRTTKSIPTIKGVSSDKSFRQSAAFQLGSSQYQRAFSALMAKKYSAAKQDFSAYIQRFPQGRYLADAHYWLGEIALKAHQYRQADQHYQAVVTRYSHSSKVADAAYKLAVTHLLQGHRKAAKKEFQAVVGRYSHHSVAKMARIKLEQLSLYEET